MSKIYLLKTKIDLTKSDDRLPPISDLIKKVSTNVWKHFHQFCLFQADIGINELNNLLEDMFSFPSEYLLIEIKDIVGIKSNLLGINIEGINKMILDANKEKLALDLDRVFEYKIGDNTDKGVIKSRYYMESKNRNNGNMLGYYYVMEDGESYNEFLINRRP